MNYNEAMGYLQEVSCYGGKLGLESIQELLKRLNHPEDELKFVHVAGTNGKGSTSAYLASILVEAGYTVGRYISPVVVTYEECIQVVRKDQLVPKGYIKKEQIAKHLTKIKEVCDEMVEEGLTSPTAFEIETVMAFLEFIEQKVDIVILEVGLGGRLDATNVIKNVLVSVMTSISMDHMQFLGNTLGEITREKAGIIKPGVPVVSYDQQEEAKKVIKERCKETGSRLYMLHKKDVSIKTMTINGTTFLLNQEQEEPYYIPLLGEHQVYNASVAMAAANVLVEKGFIIDDENIRLGLANTKWFGRFSVIDHNPYVIVDGAHNIDAADMLCKAVEQYFGTKKGIFVIGVFQDKEYEEIIKRTAKYAKTMITVMTNSERALSSEKLGQVAKQYCDHVIDAKTIENGMQIAKQIATKEDYILCFGSLSFLADITEQAVVNC
ncbi:MAG: folylpolyglutamate synthase/dihydrofolate synthase family protein [bacterium]|nr:folylpolyglutamate synthase/dihydrofolate synthase family protein [bacterium]